MLNCLNLVYENLARINYKRNQSPFNFRLTLLEMNSSPYVWNTIFVSSVNTGERVETAERLLRKKADDKLP